MSERTIDRDRDELRRHVERLEAVVERSNDVIVIKDEAGVYRFVNLATVQYFEYDESEILGSTATELWGEEVGAEIRTEEEAVLETEERRTIEETLPTVEGERVFDTTRAPYYDPDGDLAGTVTVCRDVTKRKVRERKLQDQRDELETLNRINDVMRSVVGSLIGEPSRDEIAEAVCEQLVDSELYQVAWVGEPDASQDTIRNLVGANLDQETRDLLDSIDVSEESEEPVPRAYYDESVQVVQSVPEDDSLPEQRREDVLDRGDRSGISVPLSYGDSTYGVLTVGSDRLAAFSDREAEAFEVLGEVIGFAISAVRHRRLALSDSVVEVEFRGTNQESFFIAVSDRLDCTMELQGITTGPDGTLLSYDVVRGAHPDDVLDAAAEWDDVTDARVVSEHDDATLFEFTLAGSSVVVTLSEYGAKTRDAVTENGVGHVVAELPAEADVREVVEQVQDRFADLELVAKREREREVRSHKDVHESVAEGLTESQRSALQAAFFAGYYEWPRDSTAEEVADSLGISSPTLHQHLRSAERELLAAFFDHDGNAA